MDLEQSRSRLIKGNSYKDCSTVVVVPTRGMVHMRVVMSWRNLMMPMNQKAIWMPIIGMEVGQAYTAALDQILGHPELSKWKYMLTLEEDNTPPPDGLLKLIEAIEKDKQLAAVGGLYWTKGPGGVAQIWGDPEEIPKTFRPQIPRQGCLQYCNGTGMGFTLFRISVFKDKRLPKPLFKTVQEYTPGLGAKGFTQDLYAAEELGKLGYKFAVQTDVLVGHHDATEDQIW